MTTIIINEKNSKGKMLLELLRKFEGEEYFKISNDSPVPNAETIKAIKEAKSGKVNKYKNSAELFAHLHKKFNV